jgi:hypothetical protein
MYLFLLFASRFGGTEVKSSNMTPPWGTGAPWAELSDKHSSTDGQFGWNNSNLARYEQGTTFYTQVRHGK